MRSSSGVVAVLLAVFVTPACTGLLGGAAGPDNRAGGTTGTHMPGTDRPQVVLPADPDFTVGESPLRLLSRAEYIHTVTDIFGRALTLAPDSLPSDEGVAGFTVGPQPLTQAGEANKYLLAAESIAAEVTTDLGALLPCAANAIDEACVGTFIDTFGKTAFRRPLDAQERDGLLALYRAGRDEYGDREGVELVLSSVLSSASFLYRIEGDPENASPGAFVRLGSYEVATRLAFLVWNAGPDAALIDAATAGKLDTAEGIAEELERLLADEAKAKRGFRAFYEEWLVLSKLAERARRGAVTEAVATHMADSFRAIVDEVVWSKDGNLADLLQEPGAYVSSTLAPYFGTATASAALIRVDSVPNRHGILGHPAFLAGTATGGVTDPIHRGKFVREELLCGSMPAPDLAEVRKFLEDNPLPDGVSERDRANQRLGTACKSCHQFMDPIGFAFQNFNGFGQWSATESNGTVADASGHIAAGGDAEGEFDGFGGMVDLLAGSDDAERCVAERFLAFAVRRGVAADRPSIAQAHEVRGAAGGSLKAVFQGVVASDSFLFRRIGPAAGES